MAKVIIQGTNEENSKLAHVIKDKFPNASKKAVIKDVKETMTVLEITEDIKSKDEFSNDEIDKALLCCSSAERNCADCPYRGVPECSKRVLTDGAVMVSRRLNSFCGFVASECKEKDDART